MAISPYECISMMGHSITGDIGDLTFYKASNGTQVFFKKSPPLTPPNWRQINQRNRWRSAAGAWRALSPADRNMWRQLEADCRLAITGYNLWVYWQTTRDAATIRTLQRQAGVILPGGPDDTGT